MKSFLNDWGLILAVFLAGLGLGSSIGAAAARRALRLLRLRLGQQLRPLRPQRLDETVVQAVPLGDNGAPDPSSPPWQAEMTRGAAGGEEGKSFTASLPDATRGVEGSIGATWTWAVGALAIAAKSGLLGKFWKLIVAAFVAIGAGIKRVFGKKSDGA